jgi:hypothetical protein
MNKPRKLSYPKDPNECGGYFYVLPLSIFTAKGFHWSERVELRQKNFVFNSKNGARSLRLWLDPKLLRENDGMVRLDDGSVCRCKDCLEGRREVKAGWTPWK